MKNDQEDKHTIKILPEHIVNQIKAGEVIERPSALLKELIENSIDAFANKIKIQISECGMDLISVEDNGKGITYQDLPFAFCRHATSKLEEFRELYHLHSYGFRGEALASMASISKISCTSYSPSMDHGAKIVIEGGIQKILTKLSINNSPQTGTSIFVKDLFYNTPVRLKFIRSKVAEKNALVKMIHSYILSHPQISFSIKWDEKETTHFKTSTSEKILQSRFTKLFYSKANIDHPMININSSYEGYHIGGIVDPSPNRGHSSRAQFIFINERPIIDKQLHQSIVRSMQPFWPIGSSGNYSLHIELPTEHLDVNVHPNKTFVKFEKPSLVFTLISSSIKHQLSNHSKIPNSEENNNQSSDKNHDLWQPISSSSAEIFSDKLNNHNYNRDNFIADKYLSSFTPILPPNFGLLKNRERTYLIDLKSFWKYYFSQNMTILKQIPESELEVETIPLLISDPIICHDQKIDQYFSDLKKICLEIDRLDETTLLLRSIPQFLKDLPYKKIIEELINNIKSTSKDSISQALQNISPPMESIDLNDLCSIIGFTKLTEKK